MKKFFSDRELDKSSIELRDSIELSVYDGVRNTICKFWANNNMAKSFPQMDGYGHHICGSDWVAFRDGVMAMNISFDFINDKYYDVETLGCDKLKYDTFDLIEYVYSNLVDVKEKRGEWYDPLVFLKTDNAKQDFRSEINTILERNYVAYFLDDDGKIQRKFDIIQQNMLSKTIESEETVEQLIEEAKSKFNSPKFDERKIGLWKVWQAYERIKSLKNSNPKRKQQSIAELLKEVCNDCTDFYEKLNEESVQLTSIGNKFSIRHSEMSQIKIDDPKIVDYLFFRMYSLVLLLTKSY